MLVNVGQLNFYTLGWPFGKFSFQFSLPGWSGGIFFSMACAQIASSLPHPPTSDNYGFVTYRYAEEAFAAIESGHKLRQADEQPFDLCFGGRRQFCKRSYSDLGK